MTTNFGGVDVVPLGAIAGCHCSVLWWGEGRVTTNFGGVDVVPLRATVRCHCSVLWLGGRVATNFGGVDVVPLQGAIVVCHAAGKGRDGQVWGSGAIAAIVVCCGWGGGRRPTLGEWCHCWVPLQQLGGGEGDDQLWGSGRGAIAGCPYAAMASRQTALNFLQTLHCSLR